jgi:hypothetical protein
VLSENHILEGIACRADPNPLGAASYLGKKRQARDRAHTGADGDDGADVGSYPNPAFLASAEDAICVFDIRLLAPQMVRYQLTFIVHRRALVALVEKYRKRGNEADPPDVCPGRPSSSAPSEEPLPTTDPGTDVALGTEDEILSEDKPPSAPTIPWAEWGTPITRWFNSDDDVSTQWIASTAGQRYVRISDMPAPIFVMDFNPHNIRRMKKYWSGQVTEGEESDSDEDEEVKEERRRVEKRKGKAVATSERPKQTGAGFRQDLPFLATPQPQPMTHGQTVWHPGFGDGPHYFSDPFGSIFSQCGSLSFPSMFSWEGSARWGQYYNQLAGHEEVEEEEEEEEDYWGRQDDEEEEEAVGEEEEDTGMEYDTDIVSRFRYGNHFPFHFIFLRILALQKLSHDYHIAHMDKVQLAAAFVEPVHGALPYVGCASEAMHTWHCWCCSPLPKNKASVTWR